MATTTTIGTQGYFGTATDRIAAIATQGYFLAFEGIAVTNLVLATITAYVPSVQVSAKAPSVSVTAYVPSVKVSAERDES